MMPPIWLIVGLAFIAAFTWLAARFVLRRRAAVLVVDGREFRAWRRRDSFLFTAAIMGLFILLVLIGASIEREAWLLPPLVLFAPFMLWALWMSSRAREASPTEDDVRRAKAVAREGRLIIPLLVLLIITMYGSDVMDSWLDGWLSFFLFVAGQACVIALFYLSWRVIRRSRVGGPSGTRI